MARDSVMWQRLGVGGRGYVAGDMMGERLEGEIVRLNSRVATLDAEVRRVETTLESTGDSVISVDTVLVLNPAAEMLTGWRQIEVVGQPLAELFRIVDQESDAEVEISIEGALRRGSVLGSVHHTLVVAKNGSEHAIVDHSTPIHDASGAIAGTVIVLRELTEQCTAQTALQESKQRHRALFDNVLDGVATC